MYPIYRHCTLFLGLIVCVLTAISLLLNELFFHFQGNNYFPEGSYSAGFYLLIIYLGVRSYFPEKYYLTKFIQYFVTYFFVMSVIALFTNAIQYTPFPPIDDKLIAFENLLHIHMEGIVAWTNSHSNLQKVLAFIYDTLPYQLSFIPVIVAAAGEFERLREFFCLLLISALIGFSFYYFFPTTAPASMINSPFFSKDQLATGLKFFEIHHHLQPSTNEGGLIALPSFHTIWAWLCLYLVWRWKVVFFLLLPINLLLVCSCVLLGWHYPIDVVGGLIVVLISHYLYGIYPDKILQK